jgi:Protease inhibitor Inh
MTAWNSRDSVRAVATTAGFAMSTRVGLVLIALGLAAGAAYAQGQTPSETAKGMVGAWEISNAARDKTCPVTLNLDAGAGGYKLELDAACAGVFPSLRDVVVWTIGPNEAVRLIDSKGTIILDFTEVEAHMYEAERKGEGLYFLRTQAAIKAETVTPDQLFGDWTLLREMEKPLCKMTLSNATAGGEGYRITLKPGCDAVIADLGLATWKLDSNELLLVGRGGTWRFSESDANNWERIPLSSDPMVLMRQ